jgi:hypothetical protein
MSLRFEGPKSTFRGPIKTGLALLSFIGRGAKFSVENFFICNPLQVIAPPASALTPLTYQMLKREKRTTHESERPHISSVKLYGSNWERFGVIRTYDYFESACNSDVEMVLRCPPVERVTSVTAPVVDGLPI